MKGFNRPTKADSARKHAIFVEQPVMLSQEYSASAFGIKATPQHRMAVARQAKQSGIAVVEFTVVVAFFLTLILTIIDIGMYGYVKLTMQHAVREGARYAVTGQSNLDPEASNNREAAIIQKITNSSNGFLSKVIEVDDIRVEDLDGNAVSGFGGPGEVIAIHLDCEWPTTSPYILPIVDDGTYKFTVSAAMKNESF